ncbi:MAG: hypothetical protein R3228_05300 [Halioglobus sp.]|nr:hypothetical protein [Halioglobus sp.]
MSRDQDEQQLPLPAPRSPQGLDDRILSYAREKTPRVRARLLPGWMSGLAAAGIVGIAVSISLTGDRNGTPGAVFDAMETAPVPESRGYPAAPMREEVGAADAALDADLDAAGDDRARRAVAGATQQSDIAAEASEELAVQAGKESTPVKARSHELARRIDRRQGGATTEAMAPRAGPESPDGAQARQPEHTAKRQADIAASAIAARAVPAPAPPAMARTTPAASAEKEQPADPAEDALVQRELMEAQRYTAREPMLSIASGDKERERAAAPAPWDPNSPLRVRAAVDGCLALRRESGEEAAARCYRALRTLCRDCGLPVTLAEAAQQRHRERQDAPSDPNAPGE